MQPAGLERTRAFLVIHRDSSCPGASPRILVPARTDGDYSGKSRRNRDNGQVMAAPEILDTKFWPPSRNEMPSLDDWADDRFFQYSLAVAFESHDWMTGEQHWLTANLGRLTDKAVREY